MPLMSDGPPPSKDDYRTEEALLWHDVMKPFLRPGLPCPIMCRMGFFAIVAGNRGDRRDNRNVTLSNSVSNEGVRLQIGYWLAGTSVVVPMINGAIIRAENNNSDAVTKYKFAETLRRTIATTSFDPESSAAAAAALYKKYALPDGKLYPDIIYDEDASLKNWRQFYELTWDEPNIQPEGN